MSVRRRQRKVRNTPGIPECPKERRVCQDMWDAAAETIEIFENIQYRTVLRVWCYSCCTKIPLSAPLHSALATPRCLPPACYPAPSGCNRNSRVLWPGLTGAIVGVVRLRTDRSVVLAPSGKSASLCQNWIQLSASAPQGRTSKAISPNRRERQWQPYITKKMET